MYVLPFEKSQKNQLVKQDCIISIFIWLSGSTYRHCGQWESEHEVSGEGMGNMIFSFSTFTESFIHRLKK